MARWLGRQPDLLAGERGGRYFCCEMRGRVFLALLTSGSVLLASALAHAGCTKDTDCKGDRVCDAGKCVSPPDATPAIPATDGAAPTPAPGTAPLTPTTAAPPKSGSFHVLPWAGPDSGGLRLRLDL